MHNPSTVCSISSTTPGTTQSVRVRWMQHPELPTLLSCVGDSYLMKQHFKSMKWKIRIGCY